MAELHVPGVIAPRILRQFRRWRDDRQGLAALEFALIAVPFFILLFGLIEMALLFIMSTILEHAVSEASRQIRTGELQKGGFSASEFRQSVCDRLFSLMNCEPGDPRLTIDVRTFASFTSMSGNATALSMTPEGEVDRTKVQFTPGKADEIVVVRVYYEWTLITPVLSAPIANMPNNRRLLGAVAVFRNEPFGDS